MFNAHWMEGNNPPVHRAIQVALGLSLVGAGAAGAVFGWAIALGWLAGAAWNAANLFLLARLMRMLKPDEPRRFRRTAFLLTAKFGLLYPAGVWLLWSRSVNLAGFTLGFTAMLAVSAVAVLPTHA